MTEKMAAFLKEIENDKALAEAAAKALEAEDIPQAVIALAAEKGFKLTEEDLAVDEAVNELSDEELENIAGGRIPDRQQGTADPTGYGNLLLMIRGAASGRVSDTAYRYEKDSKEKGGFVFL